MNYLGLVKWFGILFHEVHIFEFIGGELCVEYLLKMHVHRYFCCLEDVVLKIMVKKEIRFMDKASIKAYSP